MWASPDHARAICDRCGLRYWRSELTNQVVNQKLTGLLVCPDCNDVDHPQLQVGKRMPPTRIEIKDPRPETMVDSSFAFPPQPFHTHSTLQEIRL